MHARGDFVFVNEVGPRDGLQNQSVHVAPDGRIALIKRLFAAGIPGMEVASFVRPDVVPQMAGAPDILQALKGEPHHCSVLVPNMRGYEHALASGAEHVAVVPSATETMNQKNLNRGLQETMDVSCAIMERARADGVRGLAYVAVAFACPFEGEVERQQVVRMGERLMEAGAEELIIADTIGAANPAQVAGLFSLLEKVFGAGVLSAHFHDTRALALANVCAALECGVRKFDASIGGLGGCPFAPGAAGNLATEDLVAMLHQMGYDTGIDMPLLLAACDLAGQLVQHEVGGRMKPWLLLEHQQTAAQANSVGSI